MEWGVFKQTHWRMIPCLSFGRKPAEHLCIWFPDCRTFHLTSAVYYRLLWPPHNGPNKETQCFFKMTFVVEFARCAFFPNSGLFSWLWPSPRRPRQFREVFWAIPPSTSQKHTEFWLLCCQYSWSRFFQENTKICTSLPPYLEHGKRLHFFFLMW